MKINKEWLQLKYETERVKVVDIAKTANTSSWLCKKCHRNVDWKSYVGVFSLKNRQRDSLGRLI